MIIRRVVRQLIKAWRKNIVKACKPLLKCLLSPLALVLTGLLCGNAYSEDAPQKLVKSQVKELGGLILLDGRVEATQSLQVDKYIDLVGISTPSATPAANHSALWLNNNSKQLCTKFDDATVGCLATGSAAGTITGVTAGTGLSGGGVSGAVTLNLITPISNSYIDSSSVTKQGNTFNDVNQLVQLDSLGKYPPLGGVNITGLNASNLTSGSVDSTLIDSSSVTKQGNTFNGASQLVQLNGSTQLPALSGVNLTNLNASNLVSGTVPNARIDGTSVTLQANTFNGANQLVQLNGSTQLPAVSGALLTNLPVGGTKLAQMVCIQINAAITTTETSFVHANSTITITPTATTSRVLLIAATLMGHDGANSSAFTFYRNGAEATGQANGAMQHINPTGVTASYYTHSMMYVDSPSSTSAVLYDIGLRTTNAASSARVGSASEMGNFCAIEVVQ